MLTTAVNDSRPASAPANSSLEAIGAGLGVILAKGVLAELRVLRRDGGPLVGYFSDHDALARAAADVPADAYGAYVTLNPVSAELRERTTEGVGFGRRSTRDDQIAARRWLPIDLDPIRASGTSSTDEEHANALRCAEGIVAFLQKIGVPRNAIVRIDSGNGAHVLVRVDVPNDAEGGLLIRRCLESLDLRFSDSEVKVDLTTSNAARIWRIPGTVARKGADADDRPHRMARILEAPADVVATPVNVLDCLARMAPAAASGDRNGPPRGGESQFDVEAWLTGSGLSVASTGAWKDGRKWLLNPCPWNASHTNGSAYVVQHGNGAIAAGCHHDSCVGNDWRALRALVSGGNAVDSRFASYKANREPGIVPVPRRFEWISVRDLLREPVEEESYLVAGMLPRSGISVLAAKPKVGKSTLARNLAAAVVAGEPFLNRATIRGAVLYLALEETRRGVRDHFARMCVDVDAITIHIGAPPSDAIRQLGGDIEALKPALVIVDPLLRFLRIGDINAYAEVSRALDPLLYLARATAAHVLVLHHVTKGESRGTDGILGSTALFGSVDTAIIMAKGENGLRTISSEQRYGEGLPQTALSFQAATGILSMRGEVQVLRDEEVRGKVLACFDSGQAIREDEIRVLVGGDQSLTAHAIRSLLTRGELTRQGEGRKGSPFLYRLVDASERVAA